VPKGTMVPSWNYRTYPCGDSERGKQVSTEQVSIHDVAKYILESKEQMTTIKLQKLCFYVHAWYLVANSDPIFPDTFEAWANGPVNTSLYESHRQMYSITASGLGVGNSSTLSEDQKRFIDAVMTAYHPLTAAQLSLLTHSEKPWIAARQGLSEGSYSSNPISNDEIRDFYKALNRSKSQDVREVVWPQMFASAQSR